MEVLFLEFREPVKETSRTGRPRCLPVAGERFPNQTSIQLESGQCFDQHFVIVCDGILHLGLTGALEGHSLAQHA